MDARVFLWITCLLMLFLKLISIYFGGIACFALKKERPYPPAKKQRRFAVLIPARNEENVIGSLVESLQAQTYPKAEYDIYVIPNNCTDDTEGAAARSGARIFRCTEPVTCKGDALHQAVRVLLKKGDYDVFCVFDADNYVAPDFLTRMNEAFDAGARVAKARQIAKNAGESWVSCCYGLYFDLFHIFFNRPRAACGLSAKLVGTGFAVHREVLERMGGWNTVTIAEDAEFSSQCAQLGERIWWVKDAVTYDEQPTSFRVSLVQRRRWCSGIMRVSKLRLFSLLKGMNRENWHLSLDFAFFLMAPFAQALSLLPMGMTLLGAALEGELAAALAWMGLYLAAYYVLMVFLAVVLLWHQEGKLPEDRRMRQTVLLFPVFMASWLPLQMVSLCRETKKWEQIRHTGNMPAKAAA